MRVMATFDGSRCSEAIIGELEKLARLPDVEFVLLSMAETPQGRRASPAPARTGGGVVALDPMHPVVVGTVPAQVVERKDQAVQRQLAELEDYLSAIVARLPAGPRYVIETHVSEHPATMIIRRALALQPDVIVMAAHGRTGMIHHILGDVVEEVVRSGVAPVLVVPPNVARHEHQPAPL